MVLILGNNPLLRMIHEIEVTRSESQTDLVHVEQVSTMWQYRTSISIEAVSRELYEHADDTHDQESGDGPVAVQYPVLKLFFKEVILNYYDNSSFAINSLEIIKLHVEYGTDIKFHAELFHAKSSIKIM